MPRANRAVVGDYSGLTSVAKGLQDVSTTLQKGLEIDATLEQHANAIDFKALSKEADNKWKQVMVDLIDDPTVINDPFKYMTEFDKRSRDVLDEVIGRSRNDAVTGALAQYYRDEIPGLRIVAQGNQRKLSQDYVEAKLFEAGAESIRTAGNAPYDLLEDKVNEFNASVSNEVAGGLIDQLKGQKMKDIHKAAVYQQHMTTQAQTDRGRTEIRKRYEDGGYDMIPATERIKILDLASRLESEQEQKTTAVLKKVDALVFDYWMGEAAGRRIPQSFLDEIQAGKHPMLTRQDGLRLQEKQDSLNKTQDNTVRVLIADFGGEKGPHTVERIERYIDKLNKLRKESPIISDEMESAYKYLRSQEAVVRAEQNNIRSIRTQELGNARRYVDDALGATAPPIDDPVLRAREKRLQHQVQRQLERDPNMRNKESIDREVDKLRKRPDKNPNVISPQDLRR